MVRGPFGKVVAVALSATLVLLSPGPFATRVFADAVAVAPVPVAGGRDPRPIERYLRALLRDSPSGSVQVPLQKILHRFIRKKANAYSECAGPNCMYSAVSATRRGRDPGHYLPPAAFPEVLRRSYRKLAAWEPRQPGDLLAAFGAHGEAIHAATFVSDGILFSKNGVGKRTPYAFQAGDAVAAIYAPFGAVATLAYRATDDAPVSMMSAGKSLEAALKSRVLSALRPGYWLEAMRVFCWAIIDALVYVCATRGRTRGEKP